MECPKCRGAFQPEIFHGTEIDRCGTCEGIWFDMGERQTLKRIDGSEAIDPGTNQDPARDSKAKVLCPRDKVQMTRMVDPARPAVWIESCPVCYGVYLDAGEFRALKDDPSFWERLIRRRRRRSLA
jgi:Zn-finger nucleic acid-binding protein